MKEVCKEKTPPRGRLCVRSRSGWKGYGSSTTLNLASKRSFSRMRVSARAGLLADRTKDSLSCLLANSTIRKEGAWRVSIAKGYIYSHSRVGCWQPRSWGKTGIVKLIDRNQICSAWLPVVVMSETVRRRLGAIDGLRMVVWYAVGRKE